MQNGKNTSYSGKEELLNSEVMTNYNRFIVKTAVENLGKINQCVDFGAGIGTLSMIFRENYHIEPVCVEIDETNISYLQNRHFNYVKDLKLIPEKVDTIFSANVLEHIEDDVTILSLMNDKLKDGGCIYLFLPAQMKLWTKMDEAVGHYRRYELKELREKCKKVGFKIKRLHYADSVGFFATIAMKILGYHINSGIGSLKSIRFYDKFLFPISIFLDKIGCKYLFGKNVILIAEK